MNDARVFFRAGIHGDLTCGRKSLALDGNDLRAEIEALVRGKQAAVLILDKVEQNCLVAALTPADIGELASTQIGVLLTHQLRALGADDEDIIDQTRRLIDTVIPLAHALD